MDIFVQKMSPVLVIFILHIRHVNYLLVLSFGGIWLKGGIYGMGEYIMGDL